MGEYARRKSDRQEIKIGTCENMYYLRYEDRMRVSKIPHSLDPNTELDLRWRLPYPDEDHILPGDYDDYSRGELLYKIDETGYCTDPDALPISNDAVGIIQLHHECGLLVNVPCYHGQRLPQGDGEIKTFWNGKGGFFELQFVKNTADGVKPIVGCKYCRHMWRFEWSYVLPFLRGKLKERLSVYAPAVEITE
ncbi:MAG: hypothetical protein K2X29_10480 [Candidatus Obscuribacterales bacterium]|nr:hypothetical protein [Candidatus Obscuribacterales bacterium]